MAKHDQLTASEFATYSPNPRILGHLQSFTRGMGCPADQIRVLDWGCGRGRDVLWLRQQGYQAFGVDVDPIPVENGRPLFKTMGYSEQCLTLMDDAGRAPFEDGYFDYVFSGNVLEHVADLSNVSREMARLTRKGGAGYHVFPAHRQLLEGHLFMPFVHWLPRGRLRRWTILLFVLLGKEPDWIEIRGSSARVKTDTYYRYSVNRAFYRPYRQIQKIFAANGFDVRFTTLDHPKVRANPVVSRLVDIQPVRLVLNHLLLTYKIVEMEILMK